MRLEPAQLAVVLLLTASLACRSAAPPPPAVAGEAASPDDVAEVSPVDPNASETPPVQSSSSVGETEPTDLPATPELVSDSEAEVLAQAEEPESPEPSPEELQQWALEACQTAEELLAAGDVETALDELDRAYEFMLELPTSDDAGFRRAKEDIRLLVADLIYQHYRAGTPDEVPPASNWDLGLPMVDNERVRYEIERFQTAEREAFLEGYKRSGRYRPMILPKLEEAGLPSQLSWLPMVESWFKVRAYSRASAVGMWQFISSTGQRYGLSRDRFVDERYDPVKSTDAAVGYLSDLHAMFGDWPKALAGYNSGEARVARLQRRSKDDYLDFWDLYEMLPRETRRYVPRLFAAIAIIEDPEKYGMELPEPDAPLETTSVEVERAVQLTRLDASLGLEAGTLALLNPELRHKSTPPSRYALTVPAASAPTVLASLEALPQWAPREVEQGGGTHRVRRGQTLSIIARRYGTTVQALMRANNLRSAHRIREGQRLRVPGRGGVRSASSVQVSGSGTHTVQRGETLGLIAAAYGSSVERIRRDNGLRSTVIHPGQRLEVSASGNASAGSASRTYRVRRGDTPGGIARRHGVELGALLRANRLGRRSTIYPGQELRIPG